MIKKIEGIVLNEQSYGDSSKILNVITKDYGIIGILSKGCKKIKSNLRIVSTKLTYGNFNDYFVPDWICFYRYGTLNQSKQGSVSTFVVCFVVDGLHF